MSISDLINKNIPCQSFTEFNYDPGADTNTRQIHNMICLIVDGDTMVVAGEGILSPNDFRAKYADSFFRIDGVYRKNNCSL